MPRARKYEQPRNPAGVNQYVLGKVQKTKASKVIGVRLEIELDQKVRQLPDHTKFIERWIEEGYTREFKSEEESE